MSQKKDFRSRFVNFLLKRKLRKRTHTPCPNPVEFKKILVVSTTGIGDTLWSTPALEAIKKTYPKCEIHVLSSPLGAQVLKNNPSIDQFFVIKRSALSLFALFPKLKKQAYDAICVFHISFRWIIPFCFCLSPRKLLGFKRHAKDFAHLLTHCDEVGLRHPILQRIELIKHIGVTTTQYHTKLYLTQQERLAAENFLLKFFKVKPRILVGLQPGASQAFKQWPIEYFIQMAQVLSKKGAQIVIFGSKEERYLADAINEQVPVCVASGELSLRESAALMGEMNLVITHDTGPMHLALAQKTLMIALFSPTAHDLCWPYLTEPVPWVYLVVKPVTCSPCIGHRCKKPYCMERITPKEVLQVVDDLGLFKNMRAASEADHLNVLCSKSN